MPATIDTPASRVQMMTTAGQESGWYFRIQVPSGVARGFWQCETVAILSVLADKVAGPFFTAICDLLNIPTDPTTIYEAIAWSDPLAYGLGRAILLQDPLPIPPIGNPTTAYECYTRNWRPANQEQQTSWDGFYATALALMAPSGPVPVA